MKKIFSTIVAVGLSVSSTHATLDPFNSLIASPGFQDTIAVQGPVVIGFIASAKGNPLKGKAVSVYVDKRIVGIVPTNRDGVWDYRLNEAQYLADSTHIVEACVALASGENAWTQAAIFTIQATKPSTAHHRLGIVNVANSAINFPFGYVNTQTPVIIGSLLNANYAPVVGETVTITLNGVAIDTVTTDSNGVFSCQMTSSLAEGSYAIAAHCVQSDVDLTPNDFIVDVTPPAAPVILDPGYNSMIANSTVIVDGTSESYATVTTFLDGDIFGDINYCDGYGNWSIEYDGLANGSHSVSAQATDLANNTGPVSNATVFTVDA